MFQQHHFQSRFLSVRPLSFSLTGEHSGRAALLEHRELIQIKREDSEEERTEEQSEIPAGINHNNLTQIV